MAAWPGGVGINCLFNPKQEAWLNEILEEENEGMNSIAEIGNGNEKVEDKTIADVMQLLKREQIER